MDLKGKRILFPRSSLPNPFLKDALSAYGAIVEEIIIYGNAKPAKKFRTVEGLVKMTPSIPTDGKSLLAGLVLT